MENVKQKGKGKRKNPPAEENGGHKAAKHPPGDGIKKSPAEGSARDLGKTVQFSSAMLGETEMLPPWRETSLKKVSKKVRGT